MQSMSALTSFEICNINQTWKTARFCKYVFSHYVEYITSQFCPEIDLQEISLLILGLLRNAK